MTRILRPTHLPTLLAALWFGAVSVGCGGAMAPMEKSASPKDVMDAPSKVEAGESAPEEAGGDASEAPEAPGLDDRAELDSLVRSIESDAGLMEGVADRPEAVGPRGCSEVCELKDAICKSSSKICTIAERHPEEGYFADRCQWSQTECTEAAEKCERCTE